MTTNQKKVNSDSVLCRSMSKKLRAFTLKQKLLMISISYTPAVFHSFHEVFEINFSRREVRALPFLEQILGYYTCDIMVVCGTNF